MVDADADADTDADVDADADADADVDAHTYYSKHQPPKRKGLRSLRDPSASDRT